jgi:hypothetical protein
MADRRTLFALALAAAALGGASTRAEAQGNPKHYAVTPDKALTAARTVLTRQGFEIVRLAGNAEAQVLYYRKRDRGQGNGEGPMERMVIRRVKRHIVFEEIPVAIRDDLDYELQL